MPPDIIHIPIALRAQFAAALQKSCPQRVSGINVRACQGYAIVDMILQ